MDHEVLKLIAHIDQTRAELRTALDEMDRDDQGQFFRACATGRLADMDEREQLFVGLLAAMAIHDFWQSKKKEPDVEA
jgi:hypothetical protein